MRAGGLYDAALFGHTWAQGMAPRRVELKGIPACEPASIGLKGVFAEPMTYLRHLIAECARARDLREASARADRRDIDELRTLVERVERDAGHGVGKPLDKQVEDLADQYAFFASRLGLEGPPSGILEST